MKKVAIFGSYNGTSIGDTAILLGLLSSLERVYGKNITVNLLLMYPIDIEAELYALGKHLNINIYVITEYQKVHNLVSFFSLFPKKVLNKIFKKTIKIETLKSALKNVDHLLIGGGNLLMDLYKSSPNLIHLICKTAIKYNVPYSFIGVGAGPIDTLYGKKIFINCIANAQNIFVRDCHSFEVLKKIYPDPPVKYVCMPDLAFGIEAVSKNSEEKSILLVNIASVYGEGWPVSNEVKFHEYVENMVNITEKLYQTSLFDTIKLFYSNYPLDTYGGKEFTKKLRAKAIDIEVIDKNLTVTEIIALAHQAKLTLVTRLHAGIMAYLGGSPILAVAYQPKVKYVLQESGITQNIFDMSFSNQDTIISKTLIQLTQKTEQNSTDKQKKIDSVLLEILGEYV